MAGIAALGAYIPRYRLGPSTDGWGSRAERSVANFDEDSVTMAVAAGLDCLTGRDRDEIDGLLFATTTPPYAEKGCATIIATALDLRRDIFTADITDVLRSGTTALKQALDSVAAGSAGQVLVIASDNRQGAPRGDAERNSGDGAAAFVVSSEDVIAELEGSYSLSENMMDVWRSAGDQFVRSWEDRFRHRGGSRAHPRRRYRRLHGKGGASPPATSPRWSSMPRMGAATPNWLAKWGLPRNRFRNPCSASWETPARHLSPCCSPRRWRIRLRDTLILAASYGDGSDVMGFRTTGLAGDGIKGKGVSSNLASGSSLDSYETYARWRDVWLTDAASRRPQAQSPSVSALWREADKNIRFYGARCNKCGFVQYPPQRVCVSCQARDDSTPVRLSDQPAKVFTYSMD